MSFALGAGLLLGLLGLGLGAAWGLGQRRQARLLAQLLASSEDKLERLQREFEHFVPAEVVERLTSGGGGGVAQRRQVTMLFADLRGFTALCDQLDPAVTLGMLNEYFRRMNSTVAQHHGHVTELVGDGLLALFGALEHNPWQGRDAVLAALDMRAELARYNLELSAKGLPPLRFGIGVHGGEVVAGVMGAGELHKFSVTGDPINVASRVEGLTRELGTDILITEEVMARLDDRFELDAMPPTRVKGKPEPIRTYAVRALKARDAAPSLA